MNILLLSIKAKLLGCQASQVLAATITTTLGHHSTDLCRSINQFISNLSVDHPQSTRFATLN
jgi:hypothetical protein